MSKDSTNRIIEFESMDGDDERSDRSPSPHVHNTVQPNSVQQPQTAKRRRVRLNSEVTMVVDGAEQTRRHDYQPPVLRNSQQNKDANGNDGKRKRRPRRRNRKWKPYTQLSWEERQQRDEEESRRASLKRANRPTPYNTTQFLMEDHKVDTPDLSSMTTYDENLDMNLSSSDEIFENENEEYLVRNFTAVYDEVQSERLQQMSKEQLVNEVLELSKRVSELEDSKRPGSGGGGGGKQQSGAESDGPLDEALRSRLESVSDLEQEVRKLKEENNRLRTENDALIIKE